jgi:predicted GTPase
MIAVTAVRTGCGKSQTTRRVVQVLKDAGKKVVSIRHPMPYGDLAAQKVQRFAELADLEKHKCTIEEIEEYEPHIAMGSIIYAGVDYGAILAEAEKEADMIVWDGGNNDTSFYRPDLLITVVDPLRPGHELRYFPGEVNFRTADVIVINKMDSAGAEDVETVMRNIAKYNAKAVVIKANSKLMVEFPEIIRGKKVLVVEDGPTLTHGEMKIGAGTVAAERNGAAGFIDPRPWTVGEITATFEKYPNIGKLLPAMGYGERQIADLEKTINAVETAEAVVIGTPIDLTRFIKINKPATRVKYELEEIGVPDLRGCLKNKGLI